MAVNGTITLTKFTAPTKGTLIRKTDFDALSVAVTKLQGYAANVDNCGNCSPSNCCQSCQTSKCQSQCTAPSDCSSNCCN